MAEIRLTLTNLLQQFHFTLTPDSQTLTPFSTFFTHPSEKQLLVTISPQHTL
ncbi:hypothetical protein DSO57_1007811 [Entomophthora muscae]|uniref:Uncharacterized protein n=1 Tax=Entomophthora muscae TaxID=34485 RepID=A0ACC2S9A9_9FUNG|nr:hypothetical protein DSO57_1007811 [Entomophthora muscae]